LLAFPHLYIYANSIKIIAAQTLDDTVCVDQPPASPLARAFGCVKGGLKTSANGPAQCLPTFVATCTVTYFPAGHRHFLIAVKGLNKAGISVVTLIPAAGIASTGVDDFRFIKHTCSLRLSFVALIAAKMGSGYVDQGHRFTNEAASRQMSKIANGIAHIHGFRRSVCLRENGEQLPYQRGARFSAFGRF